MQHKLFECYAQTAPEVDLEFALNVEEAFAVLDCKQPDLLILDNRLRPFLSFSETVPLLREHGYVGKIVVISSDVSPFMRELPCGTLISAFVDKGDFNFVSFKGKMDEFLLN